MKNFATLLVLLLAGPVCELRAGSERSYWIAEKARVERIEPSAQAELDVQHVKVLYWEIGSLIFRAGNWRWEEGPDRLQPAPQQIIPVVGLNLNLSSNPDPFEKPEAVAANLQKVLSRLPSGPCVLDLDCPPRLLDGYASVLALLHPVFPDLAITASADWISKPELVKIQQSVSGLLVRFYRTTPPATLDAKPAPAPLLDLGAITGQLVGWSRCTIPWRAIFPSFAEANLYSASGAFLQNIPDWGWDDFVAKGALVPIASGTEGRTVLRAERTKRIADAIIHAGEFLSLDLPERASLLQCLEKAKAAGALGAILFYPSEEDSAGWSLRQMRDLSQTEGLFSLSMRENNFVLTNTSGADLYPSFQGGKAQGYLLELTAPEEIWLQATHGDFVEFFGFHDPAEAEKRTQRRREQMGGNLLRPINSDPSTAVDIGSARRLQFSFGSMRAGASLSTGITRLRPGVNASKLRYRVLPVDADLKPLD